MVALNITRAQLEALLGLSWKFSDEDIGND